MTLVTLGRSFTAVPPPPPPRPSGGDSAGKLANWPGRPMLRHSITPLQRQLPGRLPSGCAAGDRHEPTSDVSAPADIQGGDAVADERLSGVSDALADRKLSRG